MRADTKTRRAHRGSTLLETMIAASILMVGAAGIAGVNAAGVRLDGDGRRMTRATAIAEDLAEQIGLWGFADPRLANAVAANDDDVGDVDFVYERTANLAGLVDHVEADLVAGGLAWNGIPEPEVTAAGYERYWNVSLNDPEFPGALLDGNGNLVPDGMRVAVVVRWQNASGGFRRIVLHTLKVNPADME